MRIDAVFLFFVAISPFYPLHGSSQHSDKRRFFFFSLSFTRRIFAIVAMNKKSAGYLEPRNPHYRSHLYVAAVYTWVHTQRNNNTKSDNFVNDNSA